MDARACDHDAWRNGRLLQAACPAMAELTGSANKAELPALHLSGAGKRK